MDKQIEVLAIHSVLLHNKEEQKQTNCMNESQGHPAQGKKPDTKTLHSVRFHLCGILENPEL